MNTYSDIDYSAAWEVFISKGSEEAFSEIYYHNSMSFS